MQKKQKKAPSVSPDLGAERRREAFETTSLAIAKTTSEDEQEHPFWREDARRERALDMLLMGTPKMAVAKELGVHRNTINNWCADPVFAAEAQRRVNEHRASIRLKRERTLNVTNSKLERISIALLTEIESTLKIDADGKIKGDVSKVGPTLRAFRELGFEIRANRVEERADRGDDVKKIDISKHTTVTGDVTVLKSGVNDTPFGTFVQTALRKGVIDVEAMPTKPDEPAGELMLRAVEQILVDSDILEEINKEDQTSS